MRSHFQSLGTRLYLLLLLAVVIVLAIHTFINIRATSTNLTDYVYASAARASDLIVRSTRYGMLLNRKEDVHQIINTLGNEPGFVEINIYNKVGEIIFSTDSLQTGQKVDLAAEACHICHASDSPLVSVPMESRTRVYESDRHGRTLGLINPIRNEPACWSASCHAHSEDQTVLGVLDVQMSLAGVEERAGKTRMIMAASSLVVMLVVALILGFFIWRFLRRPLARLKDGMNTVASGNLDTRVGIHGSDEIGELAVAFDRMAQDLKRAQDELHEWGRTLEDRIADKTEELQQAQSQIIHMEKMASLGKLSASVAHEINNPLFGILTYSTLIQRELGENGVGEDTVASIRKYVAIICEESRRCGDIVKSLLDFARHGGAEFSQYRLGNIVEQTLFLLDHHFEMQQVTVRKTFRETGDELTCDARQIQQAIMALCINAVEAMPDGGTLTLRTEGGPETVSLSISDTGVGIPKEEQSRIFEPFFTTKEGQSGLGLGLAVVYGIIQRHQGKIDVESEPNVGTVITVTLPRRPTPEENGFEAAPGSLLGGNSSRTR